jgi:hypothetical protein
MQNTNTKPGHENVLYTALGYPKFQSDSFISLIKIEGQSLFSYILYKTIDRRTRTL